MCGGVVSCLRFEKDYRSGDLFAVGLDVTDSPMNKTIKWLHKKKRLHCWYKHRHEGLKSLVTVERDTTRQSED